MNTQEKPSAKPDIVFRFYPPGITLLHCVDQILMPFMFWLSVIFLAGLAGVLHRHNEGQLNRLEAAIMFWSMIAVWPIFILEGVFRFRIRVWQAPFWTRFGYLILTCLFPPIRMGGRSYVDPHLVWFPFSGWRHVDKHFRKDMEKKFSIPMIAIALLVIPLLILDFFSRQDNSPQWIQAFNTEPAYILALDIGTAIIWMAFAFELIVMLSIARKKLQYCIQHWIDVAVVLLPFIDFIPVLRLFRLSRVISMQKISRMGRLYRLRGLVMRVWRSLLALEVLKRLLLNSPQKRLKQLEEVIHAREEEIQELYQEMEELKQEIEKKAQEETINEPVETK